MSNELLDITCAIARRAGKEILRHFDAPGRVETKDDHSPLTEADKASHRCIVEELERLTPDVRVVSEEGSDSGLDSGSRSGRFWLVDPLDGTKEFIKRSGHFTVNIALIQAGRPILGVVHAPVLGLTYFAEAGKGAWKESATEGPAAIRAQPVDLKRARLVGSKDHAGEMVKALIRKLPNAEMKSMGSSLKFCLIAEGSADIYLRDVPTMEWDTAAAHCVVNAAGGKIYTLEGNELDYGKAEYRNPLIITVGDPELDWKALLD